MVNLECQPKPYLFNNKNHQSCYLPKMSSSVNLYHYLTNNISSKFSSNPTDDDDGSDNDLSIETNPLTLTSSESSDSAIVVDEIDDVDLNKHQPTKSHSSWPEMLEKSELSFTSFSQSFHLLNQFDQQNIYDNYTSIPKYKRPLPCINSIHNYISSNKV